jgi:hypothetical protein
VAAADERLQQVARALLAGAAARGEDGGRQGERGPDQLEGGRVVRSG